MSYAKIIIAATYQKRLGEIEDFIWETSGKNLKIFESFLDSHDSALEFLKQNPTTPSFHPHTGDRSWPFADGRYRIFFRISDQHIELLDLIDNRMSNQAIYPDNVLPTFYEDESILVK